MSVDYDANFGIGYEVRQSEAMYDSEALEDGLHEYLYENCGDGFECFEVGNLFSGEISGTYLMIKEPFKGGLDLTAAKERLDAEVIRLNIDSCGDFGAVGGLRIW